MQPKSHENPLLRPYVSDIVDPAKTLSAVVLQEHLRATGDSTQIVAVGKLLSGCDLQSLKDTFNGYIDGAVYVRVNRDCDAMTNRHPSADPEMNNIIHWYQGMYGVVYSS